MDKGDSRPDKTEYYANAPISQDCSAPAVGNCHAPIGTSTNHHPFAEHVLMQGSARALSWSRKL